MSGDEDAFAWFFSGQYPQLVRTLRYVVRDQGAAEDLAQEAFVRLHQHWAKVSRYDRPDAWVRRVALNLATSWWRREGRRGDLERRATDDTAAEPVSSSDDRVLVAQVLRELPRKQRALVVLYYLEDRPLDEVAHILGMSPGAAKVALHRTRQRMATLLYESDVTS